MTLAGTRPILQDELQKYELHHRARIAIKPGITGMWQVSGRSDIINDYKLRLDSRLKVGEDLSFNLDYITYTNSITQSVECSAGHCTV